MSRRSSWELLQPYRSPFIGLPVTGSNFYYQVVFALCASTFRRAPLRVAREYIPSRQASLTLEDSAATSLEIKRLAATLWHTLT